MDAPNINLESCKSPIDNFHDYDPSTKNSFSYEFKWEGIVREITEESIVAHLIESSTNEEDELIFPLCKIPADDKDLVEIGALFNFYVGYSNINGTNKNLDIIKFRRKTFDSKDIDDILDAMNDIGFDNILEDF